MSIILYIILGGIVGWVAAELLGRKQGMVADIAVGVVGALIGDGVMQALGGPTITGLSLSSFLVALLGAVIFLLMLDLFRRGSRRETS